MKNMSHKKLLLAILITAEIVVFILIVLLLYKKLTDGTIKESTKGKYANATEVSREIEYSNGSDKILFFNC